MRTQPMFRLMLIPAILIALSIGGCSDTPTTPPGSGSLCASRSTTAWPGSSTAPAVSSPRSDQGPRDTKGTTRVIPSTVSPSQSASRNQAGPSAVVPSGRS